ncbi:PHP domain-containing protein [soil metagenome]
MAEPAAPAPRKVRLDMHTHTEFSPDSRMRLADYAAKAAESGLGAVCITDHNTVAGALRLREMDVPFKVIVGEEIYSLGGEIVGLFLTKAVPPHLPAAETIERIQDQGGLAYIPHPFSRNRLRHLKLETLTELAPRIDVIEVFNAREMAASSNAKALAFALAHGIPGGVGSDSHRLAEVGRAYVEIAEFETAPELVIALREGTATGKLSGMAMHVRTWGDAVTKAAGRLVSSAAERRRRARRGGS